MIIPIEGKMSFENFATLLANDVDEYTLKTIILLLK